MVRGEAPLVLFGAFDRHNFGDLLLGEVARALVRPQAVVFAGLAERDLTAFGGERTRAVGTLADEWGERPAAILHVGGELLTCSLYEAAIMLLSGEEARAAIALHDTDPEEGQRWAAGLLGMDRAIAYQVPRGVFRKTALVGYLGVGGVALGRLPDEVRRDVIAELRTADCVWVRDRVTLRMLEGAGVSSLLAPDPAEMTTTLFSKTIDRHGKAGEPASVRRRFPLGYLPVQLSADFGDDATLDRTGHELHEIQRCDGLGIVLFRTGGAPWHDSLAVYQRLLERSPRLEAILFRSLHLWDICALLAHGRGFVGSSLHARIVAEAHGHPAASLVSVRSDGLVPAKVQAYVESWHPQAADTVTTAEALSGAFGRAVEGRREMVASGQERQRLAAKAAAVCLSRFQHREIAG